MDVNVTTEQAAECLTLLKRTKVFLAAKEIADILGIGGCRETQRRTVRRIIQTLREDGAWIVADGHGCRLTDDLNDWRAYNLHRQIDGKTVIGTACSRQRMAVDAAGQGLLFVR